MLKADDLPFPDHAYIPGKNERHADGFLDHILDLAPAETLDATASENVTWNFGIRLLAHAYYWEAHEVLERVWLNAAPNGRERILVQGMIHMTNAALKVGMERPAAAQRLAGLAASCIDEVFAGHGGESLMGLGRDRLTANAEACAASGFSYV